MNKENRAPPECKQPSNKLTQVQRPKFKCKRKLSFLNNKNNNNNIMPPTISDRLSLNIDDILDKTDPEKLVHIIREKRGLRNVQQQRIFVDSGSGGTQQRGSFPIEVQQKEKPREVSSGRQHSEVAVVSEPADIDEPMIVCDENSANVESLRRRSSIVQHHAVKNAIDDQVEKSQKSTKSTRIPLPRTSHRLPSANLTRRALHNAFDRVQSGNNEQRELVASTPLSTRASSVGNVFGSDISNIEISPSCEFLQNNAKPDDKTTPFAYQTKNDQSAISHEERQEHNKCPQGTRIQQESMEIDETRAGPKSTAAKSIVTTKFGDYLVDETNLGTQNNQRLSQQSAVVSSRQLNVFQSQAIANASRNSNVCNTRHQSFAAENRLSQRANEPLQNFTNSHMDLTGINQLNNTQNQSQRILKPTSPNISVKKASNMVSVLVGALRRSRANSFLAPQTPPRSQNTPQKINDASFTIPPTQSPNVHHTCLAPPPSIAVIPVYPPQMCNQNHSQLAAPSAFTPVKATQQPLDHSERFTPPLAKSVSTAPLAKNVSTPPLAKNVSTPPLAKNVSTQRPIVETRSPTKRSSRRSAQRSSHPIAESCRRDIPITSDEDASPRKRPVRRSRSFRSDPGDIPPNGDNETHRNRKSNRSQSKDLTQFEMTSDEEHSEDRLHRTHNYTQTNPEAQSPDRRSQSNAVDLRVTARRNTVDQIETTQSQLCTSNEVNGDVEGRSVCRRLSRRSASFNDVLTVDRLLKQLENRRMVDGEQSTHNPDTAVTEQQPGESEIGSGVEVVETFDEDIFEEALSAGNDGYVYDISPRMGKLWIDSMLKHGNSRKTMKAKTKKGQNVLSQNVLRQSQGVTYNEVESCLRQKIRSTRLHKVRSAHHSRRKLYSKGFSENEESFSDHERSMTFLPGSGHPNDVSFGSMQSVLDRKSECIKFQSTPKLAKIRTIQNHVDDWFGTPPDRGDTPPPAKKSEMATAKTYEDDEIIFKMPHAPIDRKLGQRKQIHLPFRDKTNVQDPIRHTTDDDESAYHSQSSRRTNSSANRSMHEKSATRRCSQIIRITRTRLPNCSKLPEISDEEVSRTTTATSLRNHSRSNHDPNNSTSESEDDINQPRQSKSTLGLNDKTETERCEQPPVDPDQNITKNASDVMKKSRKSPSSTRRSYVASSKSVTETLEDDRPLPSATTAAIEVEDRRQIRPPNNETATATVSNVADADGSCSSSKLKTPSKVAQQTQKPKARGRPKKGNKIKSKSQLSSNAGDPNGSCSSSKLITPARVAQQPPNNGSNLKRGDNRHESSDLDSEVPGLRRSTRKHRQPRPYWSTRAYVDYNEPTTINYKEPIKISDTYTKRSKHKSIVKSDAEKKHRIQVKKSKQGSALKAVREEREDPEEAIQPESILSPVEDDKEPKQQAEDLFDALKEMSMNKGSNWTKYKKPPANSEPNDAPRPTSPTPSTSTSSTSTKRKRKRPAIPKTPPRAAARNEAPASPASNYMSTDSGHATDSNNHQRNATSGQNFILAWLKKLVEPRTVSLNPALDKILHLTEIEISPADSLVFQSMNGVEYAYYDTSKTTSEQYGYMRFHPKSVKRKARTKFYGLRLLSLMGELELCIGEKKVALKNGDFITVPKGVQYKLLNKSDDIAVLFFMQSLM